MNKRTDFLNVFRNFLPGLCLLIALGATPSASKADNNNMATLYAPAVTTDHEQAVRIPIIIDAVDALAGLKLVIAYDAAALKYETAEKGPAADAFLHVINDKKPGELILVMAGAKGISGKDITLMTLQFASIPPEKNPENPATASIRLISAELMSDQLEYIPFQIRK